MTKKKLWMMTAILTCSLALTACSNSDNNTTPDLSALTEWQAGKTVSDEVVMAYGGLDKCFAAEYCDRTKTFPYKIDHDDLCFKLFTEAGFEWGGDWTTRKDFQHFELIE